MDIKTRLEPNTKAWFLHNNKVNSGTIKRLDTTSSADYKGKVTTEIHYLIEFNDYEGNVKGATATKKEGEAFETKEALLAAL